VHPAASAGPSERIPSATGEFHGGDDPRHACRLPDNETQLAVTHLAVGARVSQRERCIEPQRLGRERHLEPALVVSLAVLEPEQVDEIVGPLLEPVRHPGQYAGPQGPVSSPDGIDERAPGGLDRRVRLFRPAHRVRADLLTGGRVDRDAMLVGVGPPAVDPVHRDLCGGSGHGFSSASWHLVAARISASIPTTQI
jgi:hypothetical protein